MGLARYQSVPAKHWPMYTGARYKWWSEGTGGSQEQGEGLVSISKLLNHRVNYKHGVPGGGRSPADRWVSLSNLLIKIMTLNICMHIYIYIYIYIYMIYIFIHIIIYMIIYTCIYIYILYIHAFASCPWCQTLVSIMHRPMYIIQLYYFIICCACIYK